MIKVIYSKYVIFAFSFFFSIIGIEWVARKYLNWQPCNEYYTQNEILRLNSKLRYYVNDSLLGYKLQQGVFYLPLKGVHGKEVHHGKDGYRKFVNSNDTSKSFPIHLYGCSIAYGYCVSDSNVVSKYIANKINLGIKNYGIPSHGLLQAFQKLKSNSISGNKPQYAIFMTGSHHIERDNLTKSWRKRMYKGGSQTQNLTGLKLDFTHEKLMISKQSLNYSGIPGIKHSGLLNQIDDIINEKSDNSQLHKENEMKLVNTIVRYCKENKIISIFGILTNDQWSHFVLEELKQKNVLAIDLSEIYSRPECTCLPQDPHPNQLGHRLFADKFLKTLNSIIRSEKKYSETIKRNI